MYEFETGGFSNPRRFRDEFFNLLALPQVRVALKLAGERAMPVKDLENFESEDRRHAAAPGISRQHRDRLVRLGLIQGNRSNGYRLTAAEVLPLIDDVDRSPEGDNWWRVLSSPTARAILAALLDHSRESSYLRATCGSAPRVSEALERLTEARIIVAAPTTSGGQRMSLATRTALTIVVQSELIIYGLLTEAADHSHAVLSAVRQRSRDMSVYEPGPHEPRQPPPHPLSALEHVDPQAVADVRIYSAFAGVIPTDNEAVFPVPSRLRAQRHAESTPLHLPPQSDLYLKMPRADAYTALSLREQVANERSAQDEISAIWPADRYAPVAGPPSASQLRGRRRANALAQDPNTPLTDLELPLIRWVLPDPDGPTITWAAEFDVDANTLNLNVEPRELAGIVPEYTDYTGTAGTMWHNHLMARHAYRIVETVLLHEHAEGLHPNGQTRELDRNALTAAARWGAADRRDLRRELRQYFSTLRDRDDEP